MRVYTHLLVLRWLWLFFWCLSRGGNRNSTMVKQQPKWRLPTLKIQGPGVMRTLQRHCWKSDNNTFWSYQPLIHPLVHTFIFLATLQYRRYGTTIQAVYNTHAVHVHVCMHMLCIRYLWRCRLPTELGPTSPRFVNSVATELCKDYSDRAEVCNWSKTVYCNVPV